MHHLFPPKSITKDELRNVLLAAACVTVMAAIRFAVCWMGMMAGASWDTFSIREILCTIMGFGSLVAGLFYYTLRNEPRLGMLISIPGMFLLGSLGSLQTQFLTFYLSRHLDLTDAWLASIDAALGFDWPAYFRWLTAEPLRHQATLNAYISIWWQPLLLNLLAVAHNRLRDYLCLSIALPLSFILVCAVAAQFPALGAYQFHGMTPDQHIGLGIQYTDGATAPMLWLRAGQITLPMPPFPDLRLVTFPSWHAAAAAIFMCAFWPMARLRWLGLGLNVLLLMATPVHGSHYLTDLLIGFPIGIISYGLGLMLLKRPRTSEREIEAGVVAPV